MAVEEDPAVIEDFNQAITDWDKQAALQSRGDQEGGGELTVPSNRPSSDSLTSVHIPLNL